MDRAKWRGVVKTMSNDHTKSGQVHRREQCRIQNEMIMIMAER